MHTVAVYVLSKHTIILVAFVVLSTVFHGLAMSENHSSFMCFEYSSIQGKRSWILLFRFFEWSFHFFGIKKCKHFHFNLITINIVQIECDDVLGKSSKITVRVFRYLNKSVEYCERFSFVGWEYSVKTEKKEKCHRPNRKRLNRHSHRNRPI